MTLGVPFVIQTLRKNNFLCYQFGMLPWLRFSYGSDLVPRVHLWGQGIFKTFQLAFFNPQNRKREGDFFGVEFMFFYFTFKGAPGLWIQLKENCDKT